MMKESAQIAYDFLRSEAGKNIIGKTANAKQNGGVHIHVPAGAIPKDGPSAGVAITRRLPV